MRIELQLKEMIIEKSAIPKDNLHNYQERDFSDSDFFLKIHE